jgi:hypothetical protein
VREIPLYVSESRIWARATVDVAPVAGYAPGMKTVVSIPDEVFKKVEYGVAGSNLEGVLPKSSFLLDILY